MTTAYDVKQTFAVLGAGTWGLTLADLLDQNGHRVRCWDIDGGLIQRLRADGTHPKLGDWRFGTGIELTADLTRALDGARACVIVVPSKALRAACGTVLATGRAGDMQGWVICTKGIEQNTLMLGHEVLGDVLGAEAAARAGVLSGPSHAEEVCRRMPTTVVACAADPALAQAIQTWFFRPHLRVYTHDDMRGVELGASIKNVIAIAAGVLDGLGLGDNTRASLITRGLAEIVRLGLAMGARLETFMGLSGIGDLIVTATSRHSRNHACGELLARGATIDEALATIGMVVEGYPTALSAWQLARKHGVEMPITEAVHAVLYEGLSPRQAIQDLMARDPKPEHY
jgi:glycerol-3-phosphate dehydrogenase (NAD(P)+)